MRVGRNCTLGELVNNLISASSATSTTEFNSHVFIVVTWRHGRRSGCRAAESDVRYKPRAVF
jgi:hypothetical protein